jgi:hypothetical protein
VLRRCDMKYRCFGLSNWVGLVFRAYDAMPDSAKMVLHRFLGIDNSIPTHADIVHVLNHEPIASTSGILINAPKRNPLLNGASTGLPPADGGTDGTTSTNTGK